MTNEKVAIGVLLSAASGFFLVWPIYFAVGALFSGVVTILIGTFAIVSVAYGLMGMLTLIWSWMNAGAKPSKLMKPFSIMYVTTYAVGTLDTGHVSITSVSLYIAGVLIVGVLVWTHWFTVSKIGIWKQYP